MKNIFANYKDNKSRLHGTVINTIFIILYNYHSRQKMYPFNFPYNHKFVFLEKLNNLLPGNFDYFAKINKP